MKAKRQMANSVVSAFVFVLGCTAAALAVDLDSMQKKVDTAKGHAQNIKKEGSEGTQNVKQMKAPEAMNNAGQAKDEGKKLKDVVTGK